MLMSDIWRITSVARVSCRDALEALDARGEVVVRHRGLALGEVEALLAVRGDDLGDLRASAGCFASVPPTLISISTSL
jgi:hypothetical protein